MTRNLRYAYIIALSLIAFVAIVSQVAVQVALWNTQSDARIVNIAGRQRMLSQRISKNSLLMLQLPADQRANRLQELATALDEWQVAHLGLQYGDETLQLPAGNSAEVAALFAEIQPRFDAMYAAGTCLVALERGEALDPTRCTATEADTYVNTILDNESAFLLGMNNITFQYDAESTAEVQALRLVEIALLAITLITLVLEAMFIFRPTSERLERAQKELETSRDQLELRVQERTVELERTNTRLKGANTEIQDYANAVSHDLRSPIASIRGFLNELRIDLDTLRNIPDIQSNGTVQEILDGSLEDAVKALEQSNDRMDRLTRDILQIARVGERELHPDFVNVSKMVDGLLTSFSPQIKARGITVTVASLPSLVADERALEQIFSNLLSNAVKYITMNRPGKIVIRGVQEGDNVVYAFEDNGCGISARDVDKVFQLFKRVGQSTAEGDGMGLYYVRRLVSRLNGSIYFESKLDQGTTFFVRLPAVAPYEAVVA